MNRVQPGSFLTLHYRLTGPNGADVINTFGDKPATLSLGSGQLAPAVESYLIGLDEGAHECFELAPGEAFGPRHPDKVQRLKRRLLDDLSDSAASGSEGSTYRAGDVISFPTPDGRAAFAGVVREVADDWLLFDFNHPLAGQPLRFEVQLIGVL